MTAIQPVPKVVHYGEGNIFEEIPFPQVRREELKNEQLRSNLRFVTHAIRNKRARASPQSCPTGRSCATPVSVRNYVLANLPELLEQFGATSPLPVATCTGPATPPRQNQIALDLIREQGVDEIIKIKSMATAETGLNEVP